MNKSEKTKIKISNIKKICVDILLKKGLNKRDAEEITESYLYGELTGKLSHGFAAFPNFVKNKINDWRGDFTVEKEDDSYALIDAHGGYGQIVGSFAMKLAIKKAKKKGVALVGMHNMHTYLIPGYYAKMASDANMIGIVIDNAKSRVAPFGGTEPKLGTNPIGLAIPNENDAIVLDMATATRAMGEVRLAKQLGTHLPEDMALDDAGDPTRNPENVNALKPFGGYKGYGLCLAIEILAGSLVRAKMGSKIKNGLDRGFLFFVINPEIFVDIDTFKKETSHLITEVKASKKENDVDEILVPGERASKVMKACLQRSYLELDENVVREIEQLHENS